MEITYKGANCFKVTTKNTSLVIDDNLFSLGLNSVTSDIDALLYTQKILINEMLDAKIIIDGPGEYELDDVAVMGIQTRAYTDVESQMSATMYKVINSEFQVLFVGHVQPKLDTKVLEKIGVVDVIVIPVGGSGYTLDAEDASEIIKLLNPKIVVPSHYEDDQIKYEMPMRHLDEFLVKMGASDTTKQKSLKLKGELEESLVVLDRDS